MLKIQAIGRNTRTDLFGDGASGINFPTLPLFSFFPKYTSRRLLLKLSRLWPPGGDAEGFISRDWLPW